MYTGALPITTTKAITTFLHTFAAEKRQYLPQGLSKRDNQINDTLIQHYHRLALSHPTLGKTYTPILSVTTSSFHIVIKAAIKRIHNALIFRAFTMQRIITDLVRKRQQQVNPKRRTRNAQNTTNIGQLQPPNLHDLDTTSPYIQREYTPTQHTVL